jgi:4-hydroxymandelate oxidase
MAISRRQTLTLVGGLGQAIGALSAAGCSTLSRRRAPPGPVDLEQLISLADFESAARDHLSGMAHAYVAGGAADEVTLRWNREAFEKLPLRPRSLIDVSKLDTSLQLLGLPLPHPILLAPTGYHRLFHAEGEVATARGAGAAQSLLVVSSSATTTVEEIARAATFPTWFQLYMQEDRGFVRELVGRAEAAGCRALCLTVDAPVAGARNTERRNPFVLPPGISAPMNPLSNKARRPGHGQDPLRQYRRFPVTWADLEWLRGLTRLPILLKGILHPDDADLAVRYGAAGVIVSNHGGRYLDSAPATLDALPAIADKVAGRLPILMDGGIRRGTDALKALARGARAILIGRPYVWGLAAAGASGVKRVIDILRVELEMAMALTGRPTLASIDRSLLG